jgi:hypothetical protein
VKVRVAIWHQKDRRRIASPIALLLLLVFGLIGLGLGKVVPKFDFAKEGLGVRTLVCSHFGPTLGHSVLLGQDGVPTRGQNKEIANHCRWSSGESTVARTVRDRNAESNEKSQIAFSNQQRSNNVLSTLVKRTHKQKQDRPQHRSTNTDGPPSTVFASIGSPHRIGGLSSARSFVCLYFVSRCSPFRAGERQASLPPGADDRAREILRLSTTRKHSCASKLERHHDGVFRCSPAETRSDLCLIRVRGGLSLSITYHRAKDECYWFA